MLFERVKFGALFDFEIRPALDWGEKPTLCVQETPGCGQVAQSNPKLSAL